MSARGAASCAAAIAAVLVPLCVAAEAHAALAEMPPRLAQGAPSRCPPVPERLNTIQDVFHAFCACWRPPVESEARPGMEVTVRFSFTRDGEILGEPRFTFVTRDVSDDVRAVYKRAVADALLRCTPLAFTPALGNALAGRPFALRFVDERGAKKAEHHER
jgi:hypothetical protein